MDNIALVHILNNQSSKSPRVMSLIRPIMLMTLRNNIQFKTQHITGKTNIIVDAISCKQWDVFRREASYADIKPQSIPPKFQTMLSTMK